MLRYMVKSLHLVGIGGNGMAPIAEILLARGFRVTGSDSHQTELTRRLSELGATVYLGQMAEHVGDVDAVVVSTAISSENPEVREARRRGIPVVHRGEMLSELMRGTVGVCVAGSHGKTTTTSMISTLLYMGNLDPTCVVGGRVHHFGAHARVGKSSFFVAEADESDGSFLKLPPIIAVVTNIDQEHLDFYGSYERVKDAFAEFMNNVPFYGKVFACIDDAGVRSVIGSVDRRVITYGLSPDAMIRVVGGVDGIVVNGLSSTYSVEGDGERWGSFSLEVPGRHNVINSLAAIGVARELGMPLSEIREGLSRFRGVGRRFTIVGEESGILIVDDYGHHPTEIEATLAAARQSFPDRRLVVVFQPHRYTRTRDLMSRFAHSFLKSDLLVLTEVYGAGEKSLPGVTGEALCDETRKVMGVDRVLFEGDRQSLPSFLADIMRPGDVLLTLGAGDITSLGQEYLDLVRSASRIS
ncbi:MAG: UDP-N-acetylmuramate--L-alanine ligase [Leptospirillum sp.]